MATLEKPGEVCCAVLLLDLVAVHVAVVFCGIRAEKGSAQLCFNWQILS
jgi:hypothetical protein